MGKLTIKINYEDNHGYTTKATKEIYTKCRVDDISWEHEQDVVDVLTDLVNELMENN